MFVYTFRDIVAVTFMVAALLFMLFGVVDYYWQRLKKWIGDR